MKKLIYAACFIPVLIACGANNFEVKTHEWEFCIEDGFGPTVANVDTVDIFPKTTGCTYIGEFEEGLVLHFMVNLSPENAPTSIFLVADGQDTVLTTYAQPSESVTEKFFVILNP